MGKNDGTIILTDGFFSREWTSDSTNQASALNKILQMTVLNPVKMHIKWVPKFEKLNGDTPFASPLEKGKVSSSKADDFKTETFSLDQFQIELSLRLAGEELEQLFFDLVCFKPVLMRLTFQKKSCQLVDLVVKPQTPPLFFQKFFLIQDIRFVVRRDFAPKSQAAAIQKQDPPPLGTLSVYWNPFQSETSNFAPTSPSKGPFERTVSCNVGEFGHNLNAGDGRVIISFNWRLDSKSSEASFYKEGPQAFDEVFLAKNCKVVFQIEDKKLEILEFQNPQKIRGTIVTTEVSRGDLFCFQSWFFESF